MRKIKLYLVLIVTLICSCSNCQTEDEELAHIIGFLNDFSGRSWISEHPERKNIVTYFYHNDSIAKNKFIGLLKNSNIWKNQYEIIKEKKSGQTIVISEKLRKKVNDYYDFKTIPEKIYFDDVETEYEVQIGKLNPEKFKSLEEKLLFLKGVYIISGKNIENKNVIFELPNNDYENLLKILKDTGSSIVSLKKTTNITPGVARIVFEPSEKLQRYLDKR